MMIPLITFTALAATAAHAAPFTPHKLPFSSLTLPTQHTTAATLSALTDVGLISVTDIPNYAALRRETLTAASQCAMHSKLHGHDFAKRFIFPDGTNRYTLGTQTVNGIAEEFSDHGVDLTFAACEDFAKKEKEFRELVDHVSQHFVHLLDAMQGESSEHLLEMKRSGRKLHSFDDVVHTGVQLEHFHTYEKFSAKSEEDFTLDVHVDQGLFIALAPALVVEGEEQGNNYGFHIQLRDGEIVQPDFAEGDELVFMIGDGVAQWLNPSLTHPLRATPHAMSMPSSAAQRSWYGRMFLPHSDVFLPKQQQTFGEMRQSYSSTNHRTLSAAAASACSDGYSVSLRELQQECAEGSVLCWMSCQALNCSDDEELKCMTSSGDDSLSECSGNLMGAGCVPTCTEPSSVITPIADASNGFCNGYGVSMYMEGFVGVGDPDKNCIVFLFQKFVVDDAAKYVLASLATIVLGMFTEFIVSLRRRVTQGQDYWAADAVRTKAVKIFLYAMQIAFGYFAMLIAMTYSGVLFAMIVLGLTIGHVLFNFSAKVTEYSEPCCSNDEIQTTAAPQKPTVAKEIKEDVAEPAIEA